jgi:phage-related protein
MRDRLPKRKLVFFREDDGDVPIVQWMGTIPRKAAAKCVAYLARLEAEGHELRRPAADLLRDGIHELRPSRAGVHYRILYFFHGNDAVVVSHGLTKEREVPVVEIERARERMKRYRKDPARHTACFVERGVRHEGEEEV